MRFSVIIPVYNVEAYLIECVDSICKQTYKNFEIVLVDDGSTDKSGIMCDQLAKSFACVRVIHQQNKGQAYARNVGLTASSGDYIVFLDSDDFVTKENFLEHLNEKAILNPDLIFYKFSKYISGSLLPVSFSYKEAIEHDSYESRLSTMVQTDAFYGMAWIKAIRRDLLINKNIYFAPNLVCEDMDWNYNLIFNAETLELIDETYIAYRQRESSVTKNLTLKTIEDFIVTLEKWTIKAEENEELKNVVYSSLAKYYSNLLIAYVRFKNEEKKQFLDRLRSLSMLLSYAKAKRSRMINYIHKLLGLNFTMRLLSIVDFIK